MAHTQGLTSHNLHHCTAVGKETGDPSPLTLSEKPLTVRCHIISPFRWDPWSGCSFPPLSFWKEANPSLHTRTGEYKQTTRPTVAANKAAYSQADRLCLGLMLGDATDSNTTAVRERPRASGNTLLQHLTCSRRASYRSRLASTSVLINNTPCPQELFSRTTQFVAISDTASREDFCSSSCTSLSQRQTLHSCLGLTCQLDWRRVLQPHLAVHLPSRLPLGTPLPGHQLSNWLGLAASNSMANDLVAQQGDRGKTVSRA